MGRHVEARPTKVAAPCCVDCERRLTDDEILYSGGVCPYCGFTSQSTVCMTATRVAYWVWDCRPRWWQFWKKGCGHWEW
jgi:hypothetical protein